ncbi:MAG: leucine-rich repeat protein [Ruminococcus sp.]|nr:leucine-rich repeat protein [Ruminococcus sp.]
MRSIGIYAFSGCKSLAKINIPRSVISIADGAFWKAADNFIIKGYKDSEAHRYAIKNRTRFFNLETNEVIDYGKKNTMKASAKTKTIKAKKLRAKKQTKPRNTSR